MGSWIHIAPGTRFERLRFQREVAKRNNMRRAAFLCDCGKEVEISVHDVRSGHTRSCGCLLAEVLRWASRTHGATAGRKAMPEYEAWKAMKARCLYAKGINYANYGGRGISVCPEWLHSFERFYVDVGPRPSPSHSVDRIDVNGNYEPGNVRWATRTEQRRNTRTIHPVEIDGEVKLICDWAKVSGVPEESISGRLRKGWPKRDAVFQPLGTRLKTLLVNRAKEETWPVTT